jgi:peptidoglycan/LPS O-acetylase OafA/YrhL
MGSLRFLLAVAVVLFHANASGFLLVSGAAAVEAFFIISGFYMSLVLDTKYIGVNNRYGLFLGNRLLKLYPAYWTVLVLAILMQLTVWLLTGSPILLMHQLTHYKMGLPGILFVGFTNIAILGQDIISFMGLNRATGELFFTQDFLKTFPFLFSFLVIPQGWSLGIELTFYIVAPFLLRKKLYVILLVMLLVFGLRLFLIHGLQLHYDPWIFRFFPSQLLLFLAGNVSYRLYVFIKHNKEIPLSAVYIALAVVIFSSFYFYHFPAHLGRKTIYLFIIFLSLPVLMHTHKIFPYDNLLGELSYPIYLSHMLALQIISTIQSQTGFLRSIPIAVSTLVLTLVFSIAINRFVVKPIDRYRQARVKPSH